MFLINSLQLSPIREMLQSLEEHKGQPKSFEIAELIEYIETVKSDYWGFCNRLNELLR